MSPRRQLGIVLVWALLGWGMRMAQAQHDIGFLERFALATDRREALQELIPGTEEFYYFHCLYYQSSGQLAEAQATLDAWRAKLGDSGRVADMLARQHLLAYHENPQQTLDYLRRELRLNLAHASPKKNVAAELPTRLDNASLQLPQILNEAISHDRSLTSLEPAGLPLILDRDLAPDQLRSVIERLERSDAPRVVELIGQELSLRDSRGFGWAKLHQLLTLAQLNQLAESRPQLLEDEKFIRAVTGRLAPPDGDSLADPTNLRKYLTRLREWCGRLPASQNSFKALVLGNLLRLDLSQGRFDRPLFLEYLSLPRAAVYYALGLLKNQTQTLVRLDYTLSPHVPLPAMGDDVQLVRSYLEHFLRTADNVDDFARFLDRNYLERVLAETKILYGIGDAATWYAKLSPAAQKKLRERIELRFLPTNRQQYSADDPVQLSIELKNVQQLVVKIYEINLRNYYREHNQAVDTSIDLDGLVPNHLRQLEFGQPAELRHLEKLDLPELRGRGTWVVDLLGAGQRSRALIQKGRLIALERIGDAGHMFVITDGRGRPLPSAHIELGQRTFSASDNGEILVPYAEQSTTRQLLLVDDDFASMTTLSHLQEQYALHGGFLVSRQALLAGKQADIAIRARLTCNQRPISLQLLQQAKLTIVAEDMDGTATTQTVRDLELGDGEELVHSFLVPQRLAKLSCTLSGKVYNQSRDQHVEVETSYALACNGIQQTNQIADFYLRPTLDGYQLLALGRNGEPLAGLPVTLALKTRYLRQRKNYTLATNDAGIIELGELVHVTSVHCSASGMAGREFSLNEFHRDWPAVLHVDRNAAIELPLGKEAADKQQFALFEIRRGVRYAAVWDRISIADGSLRVQQLSPGDYHLLDYETGRQVNILVADADQLQGHIIGSSRVVQASSQAGVVIRDARLEDGRLKVRVSGSDPATRLHVLVHPLLPDAGSHREMDFPRPPLIHRNLPEVLSHYVDSLRLDEEYSYILDRQGYQKFPGNMLPQPSLLVHPWEVSVTENSDQVAASGDAIPQMQAAPMAPAELQAEGEKMRRRQPEPQTSYDFLALGTRLLANIELRDGRAEIPLEQLTGYSHVSLLAVHPLSTDSRQFTLPASELNLRDQRLRVAFPSDKPLSQVHDVLLLQAGERKLLGDPKTCRVQAFSTIADVFQLYSTILNNPEWEKFRFLAHWHELEPDEKRTRYGEVACHELNLFLYHKDRQFFEEVVRPTLSNKLNKQLIDDWLLERALGDHTTLWKWQQLNTLERVLLAGRVDQQRALTSRWLQETLEANPLDPVVRDRRFEVALGGSALQASGSGYGGGYAGGQRLNYSFDALSDDAKDGLGGTPLDRRSSGDRQRLGRSMRAKAEPGVSPAMEPTNDFFATDRPLLEEATPDFFQSVDKTREWAESQFYRVRLRDQTADLVPPNAFWNEYLQRGPQAFLPRNLDLPCSSVNEALSALAVIDLPLNADKFELSIQDDQLAIESERGCVVFLESIQETPRQPARETSIPADSTAATVDTQSTVLVPSVFVGQDTYVALPGTDSRVHRPLAGPLLRGVPYRVNVVVTNPTSQQQSLRVLTQIPAGAIPLGGSRVTRSTPLELNSYSTGQVQYFFYFPQAGEFKHYAAQVSAADRHLASAKHSTHRVLAEPESVDESSWSHVADWGTDEQVAQFLATNNLQQLDLTRIAFRMRDSQFYRQVTRLLESAGRFVPELWAYSVMHNDPEGIAQLLQHQTDFLMRLGPYLKSPLLTLEPREQVHYEHLDYRPLQMARSHRLGRQQVILNPSLHSQYLRLLNNLAYQRGVEATQRLPLCYYMLLQQRIDEALHWFSTVDAEDKDTRLQYDYFDAYLDFYHGRYQRAVDIAARYRQYPLPHWREVFERIAQQVDQRTALLQGIAGAPSTESHATLEPNQQLLTDRRELQNLQAAAATASLSLQSGDGRILIQHRNIERATVNFYLMDIELLFSRNPFVAREGDAVPPIRANFSQQVLLDGQTGTHEVSVPEAMRNRNLLLEVTAAGISRSTLVTASSLNVDVSEPFGRLQVVDRQGQRPVEAAYVKVFARHHDGRVRFYKDGYSDLRGQFDYASLSTGVLDSVERFAILVLDEQLGAVVTEAPVPLR